MPSRLSRPSALPRLTRPDMMSAGRRWVKRLCCAAIISGVGAGALPAVAQEDAGILEPSPTEVLPEVTQGRFVIPEIAATSTSTQSVGNGSTPKGFRTGAPRPLVPLPESASDRVLLTRDDSAGTETSADLVTPVSWAVTHWAAANTFSNPRYFEDVMLERHGHQRWGRLQPLASGLRFFTTIPMLPYKMAISPPCQCEYTLGYYRSGSDVPGLFQRPPWDRKAILVESAAVAGGFAIIP